MVTCLASSSTLNMKGDMSSETSGFLRTTRRHNPEDTVHSYRRKNFESSKEEEYLQRKT
jgi:hypothetical protein